MTAPTGTPGTLDTPVTGWLVADDGYVLNDGRFPSVSTVLIRYPADPYTARDEWPWMRGTVLGQTDRNEWEILVTDDEVATTDPDNTDPDNANVRWYPTCRRRLREIRTITGAGDRP